MDIYSKNCGLFPLYLRATLVQRPEFCLVIHRLRRSCGGFKREGLETHYPGLCEKVVGRTSLSLCDQQGRQLEDGLTNSQPSTGQQPEGQGGTRNMSVSHIVYI